MAFEIDIDEFKLFPDASEVPDLIRVHYQEVLQQLIQPPRCKYQDTALGSAELRAGDFTFTRADFVVKNVSSFELQCSFWTPRLRHGSRSLRENLLAFYEVYNPAHLHKVDSILESWTDSEEELFFQLGKKYTSKDTCVIYVHDYGSNRVRILAPELLGLYAQ